MENQEALFARLRQIISEATNELDYFITKSTAFRDDLGLDHEALEYVSMIIGIEEEFAIEIPDHLLDQFVTVNDILTYLSHELLD